MALRPSAFRSGVVERLIADGQILRGPFAGITFPQNSHWTGAVPKLLGTYEAELFPTIEAWRSIPFKSIINVGSADGYYALGCAKTWPGAKVIAYEIEPEGRQLLADYAIRNGVAAQIECRGACEPEDLHKALLAARAGLLLMDIEGYEEVLLRDPTPDLLKLFYVIVELHDLKVKGLGETLRERFHRTHTMSEVWTRPRRLSDFAVPASKLARFYLQRQLRQIGDEARGEPMRWFVMEPNVSFDTARDLH